MELTRHGSKARLPPLPARGAERPLADAQLRNEEFDGSPREFGSNVMAGATPGTAPVVNVSQSFKAPTDDRHRETRMAWNAARTQFYG